MTRSRAYYALRSVVRAIVWGALLLTTCWLLWAAFSITAILDQTTP